MQLTTISPDAMKYIVRHPQSSPTAPLITLDTSMPESSPESIIPTLRSLFTGSEYCAVSGTNNCGITEQAPVTIDAAWMTYMLLLTAMAISENNSIRKLLMMIFFLLTRSARGIMKNNPNAYPTCVNRVILLDWVMVMPRSCRIVSSRGWL